jgi:hypothetical protein
MTKSSSSRSGMPVAPRLESLRGRVLRSLECRAHETPLFDPNAPARPNNSRPPTTIGPENNRLVRSGETLT